MNNYYVYIYYRLDTNEPFYIGKGKGDRWKVLNPSKRNKHFLNIINKHFVTCEIVKNNLTESEAFYWEEEIIRILVFEYGYSIDIKNNRSLENGYHLVNQTWGGEGTSGTVSWNKNLEKEKQPWYGRHHSKETKEKLRKINRENNKGKGNPMYGKHHSEETKDKIKKSLKGKGAGKNNPKAKSVICITTCRIFLTLKDGGEFYNCNRFHISDVCKGKRNSCGKLSDGTPLVWRYLTWNHGKKYRIKGGEINE